MDDAASDNSSQDRVRRAENVLACSGDKEGDDSMTAGITPDILAVIEAAVSAYLGRKARIISVRLGQKPQASGNSWATEGRSRLNESHNIIQRGH